jgi:DNA-directed RNA polymerase specialized sigma24 family protein
LLTIARDVGLDRLRRSGALLEDAQEILTREAERSAEGPVAHVDLFDRHVLNVAACLPLTQQRVLFLRYAADMTQEQTARVLKTSAEAVQMSESRAKRELTKRLAARRRREVRSDRMAMQVRIRPLPVLSSRRLALHS